MENDILVLADEVYERLIYGGEKHISIASLPGMPGQEWIIAKTSQVTFLATTTPVLAYAGLSLGKDLGAFRRLSWRIIPVALAVTAGTFICATALAQVVLHLEGLI